ncbi:MAG: thiopurine S-methyltransferase [Myxococcota bacterium]
MQRDFWLDRWREGRINFHEQAVNPHLARWWGAIGAGRDVLVPLCGKTHDLHWLLARGHHVTGVELSPIACEAAFAEHGLRPTREEAGAFVAWRAGDLTILQGDVFDLVGAFDAVWDRAATIALPPDTRARYAAHLRSLVRPGGGVLLVTMDYPQEAREGPPFAVPEAEVHVSWPEAKLLDRVDLGATPRAQEWGVRRLWEEVWAIRV